MWDSDQVTYLLIWDLKAGFTNIIMYEIIINYFNIFAFGFWDGI